MPPAIPDAPEPSVPRSSSTTPGARPACARRRASAVATPRPCTPPPTTTCAAADGRAWPLTSGLPGERECDLALAVHAAAAPHARRHREQADPRDVAPQRAEV